MLGSARRNYAQKRKLWACRSFAELGLKVPDGDDDDAKGGGEAYGARVAQPGAQRPRSARRRAYSENCRTPGIVKAVGIFYCSAAHLGDDTRDRRNLRPDGSSGPACLSSTQAPRRGRRPLEMKFGSPRGACSQVLRPKMTAST